MYIMHCAEDKKKLERRLHDIVKPKSTKKVKAAHPKKSKNAKRTVSKETPDKSTMPKDIAESIKVKTPKQQKIGSIQHDDKQKGVTPKRNASTRSPLKGNPGKKQKDSKKKWRNQINK